MYHNPPSPLDHPTFRDDLPRYPPLMQTVRVLGDTIPGPFGYGSSSAVAQPDNRMAVLYLANVQQLETSTLLPRDREPCLVDDLNGLGLTPGYYEARLSGSYAGLPVYAVGASGGLLGVGFGGLTPTQIRNLLINLSTSQIANLNNLTPCQLQTFLQLTTSQQQFLTSILTQTQLTNLIDTLNVTQITSIIIGLTPPQIQILTNLPPTVIYNITYSLTIQEISNLIQPTNGTGLTPPELITIGNYPPSTISQLGPLPPADIRRIIGGGDPSPTTGVGTGILPGMPGPFLGNPGVTGTSPVGYGYLPGLTGSATPTSTPVNVPGYLPFAVGTDGTGYVFGGGAWRSIGGTGGSGGFTFHSFSDTDYSVTGTGDQIIEQTGTITSTRTITLPAAGGRAGQVIICANKGGTGTSSLRIGHQGGDTINGSSGTGVSFLSVTTIICFSDGGTNWQAGTLGLPTIVP